MPGISSIQAMPLANSRGNVPTFPGAVAMAGIGGTGDDNLAEVSVTSDLPNSSQELSNQGLVEARPVEESGHCRVHADEVKSGDQEKSKKREEEE